MHSGLKETIASDFVCLIERGDFVNGGAVAELERAFASLLPLTAHRTTNGQEFTVAISCRSWVRSTSSPTRPTSSSS